MPSLQLLNPRCHVAKAFHVLLLKQTLIKLFTFLVTEPQLQLVDMNVATQPRLCYVIDSDTPSSNSTSRLQVRVRQQASHTAVSTSAAHVTSSPNDAAEVTNVFANQNHATHLLRHKSVVDARVTSQKLDSKPSQRTRHKHFEKQQQQQQYDVAMSDDAEASRCAHCASQTSDSDVMTSSTPRSAALSINSSQSRTHLFLVVTLLLVSRCVHRSWRYAPVFPAFDAILSWRHCGLHNQIHLESTSASSKANFYLRFVLTRLYNVVYSLCP